MVNSTDESDKPGNSAAGAPRGRHRGWLLVIPVLLLGSLLWAANWFHQRAKLFENSEATFGPPRWKWLEPILEEAAAEYCGIPVRLSIPDRKLTARQVRMVGSYEQLEQLTLIGVNDDDLEQLSRLTNLGYLRLLDSHISEVGCQHLAGMQQLRRLTLAAANLNDQCLEQLSQLHELQWLSLHGGSFSEEGFACLAQLPRLRGMDITNCELRGDALRPIAMKSGVTTLDIHDSTVTDEMLAPFERFGILKNMTLRGTNVTRNGCIRLIGAMPSLSLGTDYELPPRDLPSVEPAISAPEF